MAPRDYLPTRERMCQLAAEDLDFYVLCTLDCQLMTEHSRVNTVVTPSARLDWYYPRQRLSAYIL